MKRIVPYIPLIMFIVPTIISTIFMIPRELPQILGFASFLFGYMMTYRSGIQETRKNCYPVLRFGEKLPYLVPIIMFSTTTIFFTAIFIPRSFSIIMQFSFCFLFAIAVYFIGIAVLILVLKKEYNRSKIKIDIPLAEQKTKRLVLINPVNQVNTGLTINKTSTYPPLGLGIIAALTPKHYEIILIDENIKSFEYQDADIVGITAFTSCAQRAYQLAKIYRDKGVPVVMGGIHCSMCPDEALTYVDAIVIGEAESVWGNVIADFEAGTLQQKYTGTHDDLAGTVMPMREIFSDEYIFATIQTSRGCPMDCYFCSVTPFNGKKYRQRPTDEVLAELETIDTPFIFFVDDNILGYGKEAEQRAIELFKGMVDRKMNKSWFCQASLNFGSNDEVLYWAHKSGCKIVFIGLESADPEELKVMHKNLNLKLEYRKAFKKINKYKIAVLGAFIYGSDAETVESMERKTQFIMTEAIDVMQTTILTPLPGTRLFTQFEKENRFTFKPGVDTWDRFDMTAVTYRLQNISEKDFYDKLILCNNKIYSRVNLLRKFILTMIHTKSMDTAFWAYNANCAYRNVGLSLKKTKIM